MKFLHNSVLGFFIREKMFCYHKTRDFYPTEIFDLQEVQAAATAYDVYEGYPTICESQWKKAFHLGNNIVLDDPKAFLKFKYGNEIQQKFGSLNDATLQILLETAFCIWNIVLSNDDIRRMKPSIFCQRIEEVLSV